MEKLTSKQEKILDTIKRFIAEKGYAPTIRELCKLCNLNSTATMFVHLKNLTKKGYISQTESKFRTIELTVPNEYIKNDDSVVNVPLLGKVAAGNPIEAIENPNEYFSLPKELIPMNHDVFTLEVSGDSMINIGIFDGDIVIVKKERTANNGEIVVAMTDENEVTLKRFYKEKDHIKLQPENDYLEPIILNNVTILGKAIGLYRKI
ncbi:MAG: transcriptional repressor LexA [Tenericutes bacterium]|nr:transcriptional repressor LexA [Mycoplasmatota bacterium]